MTRQQRRDMELDMSIVSHRDQCVCRYYMVRCARTGRLVGLLSLFDFGVSPFLVPFSRGAEAPMTVEPGPMQQGSCALKRPSVVEASWRLWKHERRPLPAKSQQSPIEAIAALTTKKPFPQPMTWRDFTHLQHLFSTVPSATGPGTAAVEHQAVCDRPNFAPKNQLAPFVRPQRCDLAAFASDC